MAPAQRIAHQPPRERCNERVKKPPISRAKRSAAWACSALRSLSFGLPAACAFHTHSVPRRHNGPQSEPRPLGTTPGTTGVHLNHAQHTITVPRTGNPHNGPSYHTLHNGQSAQRAFIPHLAQRASARYSRHDGRSRIAPTMQNGKRSADHVPRTPNEKGFMWRAAAT